ncbi:MAG: glucokinase [candidate division NC10 bacterium]|nr:glucokinase [candidate division NC10 bacterium]
MNGASGVILAGDIGGTKTIVALFEDAGGGLRVLREETFPSRSHEGLGQILEAFRAREPLPPLRGACFGVAGPVFDGRCEATNLPWVIDAKALRGTLGLERVAVINDLVATAYGILDLKPDDVVVLNEGRPHPEGNKALIAAGTGLGEAILFWDGTRTRYRPVASEGGHADFAPRNVLEIELLRYLLKKHHRVSYERVLSGPGILNIYSFLKEAGHGEEAVWLRERFHGQDPSVVITDAAMRGESDLCVKTLSLFVSLYGAEAGNLALKALATGGVYVGGGIAPKILDRLMDGTFMTAFTDKGRLSPLVSDMTVRVVLNPQTALRGAARCATVLTP